MVTNRKWVSWIFDGRMGYDQPWPNGSIIQEYGLDRNEMTSVIPEMHCPDDSIMLTTGLGKTAIPSRRLSIPLDSLVYTFVHEEPRGCRL